MPFFFFFLLYLQFFLIRAQQLKDNIKLIAEIAVPLISISVAVYLASRRCKGRNRADPESPEEDLEAIIEVTQLAGKEFASEKNM